MSIRDRVQEIGSKMLAGDPSPQEARNHEIVLSGLLSHINKAVTGAEVAYKRKLNAIRYECKSVADAKLQAEATPEFADWLEAEATRDSAKSMLSTLRSFLRSQSEEMRFTPR